MRLLLGPILAVAVFGLSACTEETPSTPPLPEETPSGPSTGGEESNGDESAGGGESCSRVPVPGHEAVDLQAQGVSCSQAEEVAAAALGKGRQAYEAAGFACEPSQAGGGDTNYVCTQGDARVTFRYGAA